MIKAWLRLGGAERVTKYYLVSAGIALIVTGGAKVLTSFGTADLLETHDPIIGITFKALMLFSGVMEIAVALFSLFGKNQPISVALVALMSFNILVYRLGLWWIGWHRPCHCLGNLSDALHLSAKTADMVMKLILAYLLIGALCSLAILWPKRLVQMRAMRAARFSAS